ncbi:hypothetical protein [Streptomyces sp. NPDC002644]
MGSAQPAVIRKHPPTALMKLVNPLVTRQIAKGRGGAAANLLLLHFTGRKSGRRYDLPAAQQRVDGRLCVFTNSGWRANFRGGADIEVTLHGKRRPMRATLEENPATVARVYAGLLQDLGPGKANRLGITVTVDRQPTLEELTDAAHRHGLSIITLTPTD